MEEELVEPGDRVKDILTGFTGIAVAFTTWLYGCDRILVQPQGLDKDGKIHEPVTFDDLQLQIVKKAAVKSVQGKLIPMQKTGGPRDDKAAQRR